MKETRIPLWYQSRIKKGMNSRFLYDKFYAYYEYLLLKDAISYILLTLQA